MASPDGTQLRAALETLMSQSVAEQWAHGNYRYLAVRPQNVKLTAAQLTTDEDEPQLDCSDGCRALCYAAGVPDDPAGNNYADYGNSSSIWLHLDHIPLSEAQIGDIITFGKYAGELHACMIHSLADPGNPTVWNMGAPGQPVFSTLTVEQANHPGSEADVCRLVLPPDPPPTPQALLRARTGFYAWVAWRLGEGAWKKYGKLNKTVRPAVPKLIPAGWWVRLARFLANRKKPNP